MNTVTKYMHELDQLSVDLREVALDMDKLASRIKVQANAGATREQLQRVYDEYTAHSMAGDAVDSLVMLVARMKRDDELQINGDLEQDIINANTHALVLCSLMLEIAKRISGAK